MTEQEVIESLKLGKKLAYDANSIYFKFKNNLVNIYDKYFPLSLCSHTLDEFIYFYSNRFHGLRIEEKLLISEAFEALKQGKKVRRFGWSTHEYMYANNNNEIVKHTDGLSISPVFISRLDEFLDVLYPDTLFEIVEEESVRVCKDKVARVNKQACAECNGTGVLDFGFYTRKCMNCSGN